MPDDCSRRFEDDGSKAQAAGGDVFELIDVKGKECVMLLQREVVLLTRSLSYSFPELVFGLMMVFS